jgi:hypothetical protein
MVKKRDPQKAEQKEKSVLGSVLKEIKSSAFRIRWKMTSDLASIEDDQKAQQEYEALVDRFYEVTKEYVPSQQYQAAKHDFEYFLRLLDLAIHYFEDTEEGVDRKSVV